MAVRRSVKRFGVGIVSTVASSCFSISDASSWEDAGQRASPLASGSNVSGREKIWFGRDDGVDSRLNGSRVGLWRMLRSVITG